jgi:hypothetical protein
MKNPIIEKLIEHIESECSAIDQEKMYDDMLDECYSFEKVGGPFESMLPSQVLLEVDPTAYRVGMADYFGTSDDYFEVGNNLYDKDEVEKARDSFVEDLESSEADLESEIEDLEADEDASVQGLAAKKRALAELQKDIEAVKQHVF